jgi:aspartokinase/homoserine dehydrogenase 1
MKVLKFGGTSVANAQNIKLDIVQNQAKQDQLIVVVSALSKVTDLLHLASLRATSTDESYKEIVADIEKKTFR